MKLNRRRLFGTAAVLGLTAACASNAPAAPPPLDGANPLIDWIAANPERASVLVDDGRGKVITHLADRPRPIASAAKVVHLTAYARSVVAGRLDPAGRVPVAEWERWYVPGAEPDTHPAALQTLGATRDGTVTWDDLAAVMIDFSDNPAPDLFRAALGDDALTAAAAAGGWSEADLPSFAGEVLAFGAVTAGADRRVAALAAARAYADDPAQRAAWAEAIQRAGEDSPTTDASAEAAGPDEAAREAALRWWDGSPAGTVTQLAGLHRAAATDALGPEVSAIVRRHLERGLADRLPTGAVGAGQKGGSYPGLVTNAFTLRRDDGTVGVSVLSLSGMGWPTYQEASASAAPLRLSQQAVLDDAVRDRLRTAVENR